MHGTNEISGHECCPFSLRHDKSRSKLDEGVILTAFLVSPVFSSGVNDAISRLKKKQTQKLLDCGDDVAIMCSSVCTKFMFCFEESLQLCDLQNPSND